MTCGDSGTGTVHFIVRTAICPHVVNRILGLFAQRGLTIERMNLSRIGERYVIEIVQAGIDARTASILAEKIRAQVMVRAVAAAPVDAARLRAA